MLSVLTLRGIWELTKMKTIPSLSVLLVAILGLRLLPLDAQDREALPNRGEYLVYVGTANYTGQPSKNIYVFRFNARTGKLTSLGLAGQADNPSSLAVHPNQRFFYAGQAIGDIKAQTGGAVSAFSIDPRTGKLTFLNKVPSHGAHPAYVSVDQTGKYLLVAIYFGGAVEAFPVNNDGRLGEATSVVRHTGSGPNPERQEAPHPHSVYLAPDNRFAVTGDLGADRVVVHRFDPASGSLTPNDPPYAEVKPGAGPRHLAFHPSAKFVYVLNELHSSISVFSYNASGGVLHLVETVSMLPGYFKGENTGAEVAVSPSGRYLYASNRGHDSIAVFSVDTATGTLTPVEYVSTQGKAPRHFAIEPTGSYMIVANQDSDNLVVFRINPKSGRLSATGQVVKATAPVCVKFVKIN